MEHFLIEVLEWAVKHSDGFSYSKIMQSFTFADWQLSLLNQHFENASQNASKRGSYQATINPETIFYVIRGGGSDYKNENYIYVLTFDALFKFIDYEELKFARENARQARTFSYIAIGVSVLAIIVSAIIPFWIAARMTQTVRIEGSAIENVGLDKGRE